VTHTTAPGSGRGKAYKDHRKRVKLAWRHQGHKLFVFRLDDLLPNHVDGGGLAAPASRLCMLRLIPLDMCFSSQPTTTVLIGDPNSRPPNRAIFYLITERAIATSASWFWYKTAVQNRAAQCVMCLFLLFIIGD